MERDAAMATVHRRFADADPELTNGFAEHATMGAEAMLSLGLDPAAVVAWAGRHEPTPLPVDSPVRHVRDSIAAELADGDWRDVLSRRAGVLVGRLDVHLFHGLIRTAHAVRALRTNDGPEARGELAIALAAWSKWADTDGLDRPPAAGGDPLAHVMDAARRGAAAFVGSPSIVTLHAVTAPMAYLLIAEHMDDSVNAAAASVFERTHRRHPEPLAQRHDGPTPSLSSLAGPAQQWDAHPAKLVEAALRGHRATGDAAFLDAAAAMMA